MSALDPFECPHLSQVDPLDVPVPEPTKGGRDRRADATDVQDGLLPLNRTLDGLDRA